MVVRAESEHVPFEPETLLARELGDGGRVPRRLRERLGFEKVGAGRGALRPRGRGVTAGVDAASSVAVVSVAPPSPGAAEERERGRGEAEELRPRAPGEVEGPRGDKRFEFGARDRHAGEEDPPGSRRGDDGVRSRIVARVVTRSPRTRSRPMRIAPRFRR